MASFTCGGQRSPAPPNRIQTKRHFRGGYFKLRAYNIAAAKAADVAPLSAAPRDDAPSRSPANTASSASVAFNAATFNNKSSSCLSSAPNARAPRVKLRVPHILMRLRVSAVFAMPYTCPSAFGARVASHS
jgi:hypothetical protein